MLIRQLYPNGRLQLGMTLIEIAITLAVLSILIMLGAPSLSEWIQNSQIRTASESIMSGLQIARNEAVRQNTNVEFRLTNPGITGGTGWTITFTNTDTLFQSAPNGEGSRNAIITPTPNQTTAVTFTGLGRTPQTNKNPIDDSALMTQIDIDSSVLAANKSRDLRILIAPGGQIRMCDPDTSITDANDTRKCP